METHSTNELHITIDLSHSLKHFIRGLFMASQYVNDGLAAIATIANTNAGTEENTAAIAKIKAQLASDEASEADQKTLTDALIKKLATAPAPALPTIAGVSPATGSINGGDSFTVTGTGLTGATALNVGTVAATNVVVVNDTTATFTGTAQAAGAYDVTVTTPAGTSAVNAPADQITLA